MGDLSWRHHTLIQSLLSRGPLKEHDFHLIFTSVSGKNPAAHQKLFNDVLLKINKALSFVEFELRGCRNQYDGNVYYGVVNNVADEQSKLGTKYTVPQIAFYKGIIEAIAHDAAAHGTISSIDALNIRLENQVIAGTGSQSQGGPQQVPAAFKTFSISQKEKTIDELVRDQWLWSTPIGDIGLGVRSFLDLRSWFRSNEVPSCEICNEAGVKAELCQGEGCRVRMHQYCREKKYSQKKAKKVCPGCGATWQCPYNEGEGEGEEGSGPDENTESQPPPRHSGTRKRLKSEKMVDADSNLPGLSQTAGRTTQSSADADINVPGPSQTSGRTTRSSADADINVPGPSRTSGRTTRSSAHLR